MNFCKRGEKVNRIKYLREKAQMTQAQLAQKVGVTQKAVAKWEVGKSLPRADKLVCVAKALHCSVDELLRQDEIIERR